jgi:arylsulfatase A-like enzyme/Flp pilus assembly protein TadD
MHRSTQLGAGARPCLPVIAILLALGPISPRSIAEEAPAPPTSLLLITLDTTRADHLGCYGAADAMTPNLDALAATGVRFDRALSPAPLTAPAHASLMTGLVPRRHGVRDNALYPLAADVPVLAEVLATHGYDTAAAVSAAVLDRGAGLARGFRFYDDTVRIGRRSAFNYEERAATQTNAAADARLAGLESPFFLWVHYFDPHRPYVPPPPYDRRFAGRPYDGEIAFMDRALGELLDRVRHRSPRTLIVVAGDHGESLGDHGEATHGVFLYQSTQRVPLIFSGTGIRRGAIVGQRVGLVDVMPTVLELLGIVSAADLDGRTLVPLLRGKSTKGAGGYEMESWFPQLAYGWAPLRGFVRDELVLVDAPRPELYDLRADPAEQHNLWPQHAAGAAMMETLRRRTAGGAPAPVEADPQTAERLMELRALGYVGGVTPPGAADAIDPKDGIAWLAVLDDARASVQLGRPEEAVRPLLQLLERNPNNVPAWLALVAARSGSGDLAGAVAAARSAAALRPDDDLVSFNLANALAAESATRSAAATEAREQYERTLRLNPRRADAYLNYASLLVRAGDFIAALDVLVRAESAEIEDPDLATERGALELRSGSVETSVVWFERAVALNPYDADAVEALARIALRRDRPAEAVRHLERLLQLKAPGDPERAQIETLLRELAGSGESRP